MLEARQTRLRRLAVHDLRVAAVPDSFIQIAALDNRDPDSFRSKQKAAGKPAWREIAGQIVKEIHRMVTEHLETPNDRNKVIAITEKYAVEKGRLERKDRRRAKRLYIYVDGQIVRKG